MWIYEHKHWSNFTWDAGTLLPILTDVRHRQGLLLGSMKDLGFDLKTEAQLNTLTTDLIKSFAIEEEILNSKEVHSSIARRLGLKYPADITPSQNVEGTVEMILDATQNYNSPLTKDRLYGWHCGLFPTGRSGIHTITVGEWRHKTNDPMQVVSGPEGKYKIHYQAPSADTIEKDMHIFLNWVNQETDQTDLFIKAGIAHLWFLTIHPFEDGNGRLARAISDMILSKSDNSSYRFYSMSEQIQKDRKKYYRHLEQQQRSTPDITKWLLWYITCIGKAIDNAETTLSSVIFKSKIWNKLEQYSINNRQRLIINRMLESDWTGHINTSKYAKIAKCANETALRDIKQLQHFGVFMQNPAKGRSTSYRIKGL